MRVQAENRESRTGEPPLDAAYSGEMRLLLAEKRTFLASLRTGIAVALVPASIWTALLATRGLWHDAAGGSGLLLMAPAILLAAVLVPVAFSVLTRAVRDLREVEGRIRALREERGSAARSRQPPAGRTVTS